LESWSSARKGKLNESSYQEFQSERLKYKGGNGINVTSFRGKEKECVYFSENKEYLFSFHLIFLLKKALI